MQMLCLRSKNNATVILDFFKFTFYFLLVYLKTLDFKKYLGWFVKFADKKKLHPNNYLPI